MLPNEVLSRDPSADATWPSNSHPDDVAAGGQVATARPLSNRRDADFSFTYLLDRSPPLT